MTMCAAATTLLLLFGGPQAAAAHGVPTATPNGARAVPDPSGEKPVASRTCTHVDHAPRRPKLAIVPDSKMPVGDHLSQPIPKWVRPPIRKGCLGEKTLGRSPQIPRAAHAEPTPPVPNRTARGMAAAIRTP